MEISPASAALGKLGIPHHIFHHENPVTSFEQAAANVALICLKLEQESSTR